MDTSPRPRDPRRDTYFQIAASILVSDLGLVAWLTTAERGPLDAVAVYLVALYIGLFGWILLAERRRPWLRWPVRRTPWNGDPDRLAALIVVVTVGALNLTWRSWLPHRELVIGLPEAFLPHALLVPRAGLSLILGSLATLLLVTVVRLVRQPRPMPSPRSTTVGASPTPGDATHHVAVRDAVRADAPDIRAVAVAAWRAAYTGLLGASTIETFLDGAYSLESLARRIEQDTFLVTTEGERIVAFADALVDAGRLTLAAIYTLPERQREGAGSLLVATLRARHSGLPIAADVLAGNTPGEAFYRRLGFVARETVEREVAGEAVVERRWWLDLVAGGMAMPATPRSYS